MVKAVIHVELTEENGKQTVSVKADGNGLDLLDMTAQIAADIIAMGADDKDLDWAINEKTLDWIVQFVFNMTKKRLEEYMAKKSKETATVAHFGKVGEDKWND